MKKFLKRCTILEYYAKISVFDYFRIGFLYKI